MNLYDKEIVRGYRALKKEAQLAFQKGDIDSSVFWIDRLSIVVNQCNWMFHDEDVSSLMDVLSANILSAPKGMYRPKEKRVVFYDQYGKYFILALQYIDALLAAGYEVLYILSDYVQADKSTFIIDDLRKKKNIHVEIIPYELSYRQRAERIQQLTIDFAPEKIFLHVKMFSTFNLVLPSLPREIQTYYIDLQDHAMWIKNRQIDYVIPYRPWGATIDIEQRGFKPEQVLLMPYYPIVNTAPFQGFPKEAEGKVVIFTGGEFYKTVDNSSAYWRLVVNILKENPNVVILYAIKGPLRSVKNQLSKVCPDYETILHRLIPIGFRTDINEVFSHCDIYLGTSPMSGGLMCQYAAYNSKPILQYYPSTLAANNETEQIINYNSAVSISFECEQELLDEAKRLINNSEYRKQRGKEIHDALITKEQFEDLFARTIKSNTNHVPYKLSNINYDAFADWWMYLENHLFLSCRKYLLSVLKKKKYLYMPISAIKTRMKAE